jgi:hypothetical protein
MLCTVTPDRYIDYFRELGTLATGSEGAYPKAILDVMSRYATEPYRPLPHGQPADARSPADGHHALRSWFADDVGRQSM